MNEPQFTIADLNKKFRIVRDVKVTIPKTDKQEGYSGPISGIQSEVIVQGMIDRGSNLVTLKATIPPPPPAGDDKKK